MVGWRYWLRSVPSPSTSRSHVRKHEIRDHHFFDERIQWSDWKTYLIKIQKLIQFTELYIQITWTVIIISTNLNVFLPHHSSYMFSQYWSLHHKTIEYIPVELLNSNHRQFVSPNNSFSEWVVFIHLQHVKLRCIGMAIYLVMYLYTECSRRYRCVYSSTS